MVPVQVFNWFVKRLLSYVGVKGKAHASKSTFASNTWLLKRLLSLNRAVRHYATLLTVVVRVSFAESG